mmetsp:Transcript_7805/g.20415  ORF Transcript_7805/g.20415 Transcript_7805/m.20415 type:complete len:213 (+) Transcript_7805:426-1064(+)
MFATCPRCQPPPRPRAHRAAAPTGPSHRATVPHVHALTPSRVSPPSTTWNGIQRVLRRSMGMVRCSLRRGKCPQPSRRGCWPLLRKLAMRWPMPAIRKPRHCLPGRLPTSPGLGTGRKSSKASKASKASQPRTHREIGQGHLQSTTRCRDLLCEVPSTSTLDGTSDSLPVSVEVIVPSEAWSATKEACKEVPRTCTVQYGSSVPGINTLNTW